MKLINDAALNSLVNKIDKVKHFWDENERGAYNDSLDDVFNDVVTLPARRNALIAQRLMVGDGGDQILDVRRGSIKLLRNNALTNNRNTISAVQIQASHSDIKIHKNINLFGNTRLQNNYIRTHTYDGNYFVNDEYYTGLFVHSEGLFLGSQINDGSRGAHISINPNSMFIYASDDNDSGNGLEFDCNRSTLFGNQTQIYATGNIQIGNSNYNKISINQSHDCRIFFDASSANQSKHLTINSDIFTIKNNDKTEFFIGDNSIGMYHCLSVNTDKHWYHNPCIRLNTYDDSVLINSGNYFIVKIMEAHKQLYDYRDFYTTISAHYGVDDRHLSLLCPNSNTSIRLTVNSIDVTTTSFYYNNKQVATVDQINYLQSQIDDLVNKLNNLS